eukprot:2614926-Pleurochrysis_carterae.AAC.6
MHPLAHVVEVQVIRVHVVRDMAKLHKSARPYVASRQRARRQTPLRQTRFRQYASRAAQAARDRGDAVVRWRARPLREGAPAHLRSASHACGPLLLRQANNNVSHSSS